MKNPVRLAYDLFDDTLMDGANYAVRTYNWTFGGTKDELANNLLTSASIAMSAGNCIFGLSYAITIPWWLFYVHLKQEQNIISLKGMPNAKGC